VSASNKRGLCLSGTIFAAYALLFATVSVNAANHRVLACQLPSADSFNFRPALDTLIKPLWTNDEKHVILHNIPDTTRQQFDELLPQIDAPRGANSTYDYSCAQELKSYVEKFQLAYRFQIEDGGNYNGQHGVLASGGVLKGFKRVTIDPTTINYIDERCAPALTDTALSTTQTCSVKKRYIAVKALLSQQADAWFEAAQAAHAPVAAEYKRQADEAAHQAAQQAAIAAEAQRIEADKKAKEQKIKAAQAAERSKLAKTAEDKKAAEEAAAYEARRADLVAGKIKIESCEDAAVKHNAGNIIPFLLTGKPSESGYYFMTRFMLQEHNGNGGRDLFLITSGAYAAVIRTQPDIVNRVPGGPLPLCAVGKFSKYIDLDNGQRVAMFDGVYIGR
jgi:hypothetical protein